MVGSFSRILLLFVAFQALVAISYAQEKRCPEFDEAFVSCEFFPSEPSRRYYLLIDERDFAPYKLNSIFHYFATKYSDIPEFKVKVFSTIEGLRAEILFDAGVPRITDAEEYRRYFEKITPPYKGYFWAIFERRKEYKTDSFRYNPLKEFTNYVVAFIFDKKKLRTPQDLLFYSATYGNMENIAEIIRNVPDVNVRGGSGNLPAIAYALIYHHNEIAKLLIERGVEINRRYAHGQTLLHFTVFENNYSGVKLLIENGADIKATDDSDSTALSSALWTCNLDLIKLLIENGAKTQSLKPDDWTNKYGLLSCKNKKEIEELLLKSLP